MKYQIVSQPHTKPPRKMIVEDDVVIAKNLKPATATRVVAALRMADGDPEKFQAFLKNTKDQGI